MMNYIFAGMVLFSFVFAALTGRMDKLSEAAMTQAGQLKFCAWPSCHPDLQ